MCTDVRSKLANLALPTLVFPKHPGARGYLEKEALTGGTGDSGHGSAEDKDSLALLKLCSQCETHTTWLALLMGVGGGACLLIL